MTSESAPSGASRADAPPAQSGPETASPQSASPRAPQSRSRSDPGLGAAGAEPSPSGAPDATARVLLDDAGIRRSLMRIAHEVVERTDEPERLYLVAIPNGGVPLARRLAANLREIADLDVPVGVLDTTLYRDDLMTTGERPALRRTEMPSAVDDHVVILVDDVVKTGRTIRAAMDALMDFGRPKAVQVVGLADRGHRELPIKLDYVGKNVPTHADEAVSLRAADGGALSFDAGAALELVVLSPGGDAAGVGGGDR